MNKYLEKIALSLDADPLSNKISAAKNINPPPSPSNHTRDLVHTATIGAAGFGASILGSHIASQIPKTALKGKLLGMSKRTLAGGVIGGALGLAGDYAAVRLNNKLDS